MKTKGRPWWFELVLQSTSNLILILQIPTSNLPTRKLSGLEAWEWGSFAHLLMLCMMQDGSELGTCEAILEEEGRGKDLVGVGVECGSYNSIFLFLFSGSEL